MASTLQPLAEAGYAVEIAVVGYPGKSVCHGGLGWSTIVLLRGHGRVALIDTGSFAQRPLIEARLAAYGLAPADVTDVILTHAHWDHSVNWVMFPTARVHIDGGELDWAVAEPWGTTPVPELYVRELARSPRLVRIRPGDVPLPGLTAYAAPGHTPGHLIFVLHGIDRDIIFTGDAAKNRAELLSRDADMTYDAATSRASIEAIWALWRQRARTLVVPGHDVPMELTDDVPQYIAARAAGVTSWFGASLDQTTVFNLADG